MLWAVTEAGGSGSKRPGFKLVSTISQLCGLRGVVQSL